MALTVLNNISSLTAENALSNTQMNLQKTLTQLSTGLKINSGSDDAAGLSIASGLNANIAALTQSQQNANNGIGLLQTADGALSQVTTLLNRAVTLATEGSTSGLTTNQSQALQTEYADILTEINQIGQATNFNGRNVFSSNAPPTFTSTQGSAAVPLTMSAKLTTGSNLTAGTTTTITDGTGTFSYTAKAGDTVAQLIAAVAAAAGTSLHAGTTASVASGQLVISGTAISAFSSTDAQLGSSAFTVAGATATSSNNLAGPTLTAGSITTIQDSGTGGTFTFKATAGESLTDLNNAIAAAVKAGTLSSGVTASINGSGQLMITSNSSTDSINVSSNDAAVGQMNAYTPSYVTSMPSALTASTVIASGGSVTINYANGGSAATYTASAATTLGALLTALNTGSTGGNITVANARANTTAQINASGQFEIDSSNGDISSVAVASLPTLGSTMGSINGASNTTTVYLGDGVTTGTQNTTVTTAINALSSAGLNLSSTDLSSTSDAQAALTAITAAIGTISLNRGAIGASVNRLTAATDVMGDQVNNLQSAANAIQDADIGKTVANMTQYNVLQATGMAALQQSNQAQQAVLKLVQ
jgi:flagellin